MVDVLHGNQRATDVLLQLAHGGLAISIITYGELNEGAYYARDQQALAGLQSFVASMELLPLSIPVIEHFGRLRGSLPRRHRQQVGDMDLLIAATALEHHLSLLTNNRRDFTLVPGLRLLQYP